MEKFELIRRAYFVDGHSKRYIAKHYRIHRRLVRQAIQNAVPPEDKPAGRPCVVMTDKIKRQIDQWIKQDEEAPKKQRHTGQRVYDRLVNDHQFSGSISSIRSYLRQVRREQGSCNQIFITQCYLPGQEAEVDWYEINVDFPSGRQKVYIFQMRACHSGKEFHCAYLRQTQQAFIEAHIAAFHHFGGVFAKIRYDNLTAAVKKVLRGRKRVETDRFIALRSHYLFESQFCLPGLQGAHEKGGVECGVGRFRRHHLVPVPKMETLEELNHYLLQCCKKDDERTVQGQQNPITTRWQEEVPQLRALPKEDFDASEVLTPRVDQKSTVRIKTNDYSVPVAHVGQRIEVRVSSNNVVMTKAGQVIATHARCYDRYQQRLNLAHYIPLLRHKPGALPGALALKQARENGAWPPCYDRYYQHLKERFSESQANNRMVEFLYWSQPFPSQLCQTLLDQALTLGCTDLEHLKSLYRQRQEKRDKPKPVDLIEPLQAYNRPMPNIAIYDNLLQVGRAVAC